MCFRAPRIHRTVAEVKQRTLVARCATNDGGTCLPEPHFVGQEDRRLTRCRTGREASDCSEQGQRGTSLRQRLPGGAGQECVVVYHCVTGRVDHGHRREVAD